MYTYKLKRKYLQDIAFLIRAGCLKTQAAAETICNVTGPLCSVEGYFGGRHTTEIATPHDTFPKAEASVVSQPICYSGVIL